MSLSATAAADLFRSAPDALLDVGTGKVAYRRVGNGPDVLSQTSPTPAST